MKKILLSSLVLASVLMGEKIVIGATPVPHAEILEVAKASLGAQGYELEIKVFNDYVLPNKALADKDLDANFMQHEPYLREFNAMNGTSPLRRIFFSRIRALQGKGISRLSRCSKL